MPNLNKITFAIGLVLLGVGANAAELQNFDADQQNRQQQRDQALEKQIHNPGRYTLSQTEFVLAFKKGRFPTPRGARNIRQLVSVHRGEHSEKPEIVIDGITKMFPTQKKIELFARQNYAGWDNWGLEIPEQKIEILSKSGLN